MKYGTLVCMAAILLMSAVAANARDYTFTPNPANLDDLEHGYYYAWMISWTPPAGETIVGAHLSIANINNWTLEPNANWLYTHLIDSTPKHGTKLSSSVWRWEDDERGGDNWAGNGKWIATYTDNSTASENLSYDLGAQGLLDDLNSYAADGSFGFGFDPDCHYYNCGVSLSITTAPVPEPTGIMVLATGMLPLGAFAVRRRKA